MKLLGLKPKNLLLKFNLTSAALSTSSTRPSTAVSSGDDQHGGAGDKHHDEDPHRFFDKDMEYIRKYAPIERKYKPPPFMGHTGFGLPDCEVFITKVKNEYPDGPEKYYEMCPGKAFPDQKVMENRIVFKDPKKPLYGAKNN
uniref:Uncharacterized protein n=1 Tax=Romanomermis culicivorax TaxID=13658 RepID=A0A915HR95_ROMCU